MHILPISTSTAKQTKRVEFIPFLSTMFIQVRTDVVNFTVSGRAGLRFNAPNHLKLCEFTRFCGRFPGLHALLLVHLKVPVNEPTRLLYNNIPSVPICNKPNPSAHIRKPLVFGIPPIFSTAFGRAREGYLQLAHRFRRIQRATCTVAC